MYASLTSSSAHLGARQPPSTSFAIGAPPVQEVNALDSKDLLQGQKTVSIAHNGSVYRLQATRLGKLILTK